MNFRKRSFKTCYLYRNTWYHWGSKPPSLKFRSPLDTKAPGPPLIYLVRHLAILDPHINIFVGPPNNCIALKQFNLLPP